MAVDHCIAFCGFELTWDLLCDRAIDASQPNMITIDGTMKLCEDLGIDPEEVCQADAILLGATIVRYPSRIEDTDVRISV